jgi:hypothetical protein
VNKYLVVFCIFFNAFVSFSQQAAIGTRTLRVSSATAVFNQNIPVGTLVIDIFNNKIYLAKVSVLSTETIDSALASFELLNDVVNDSYALVSTASDYITSETEAGKTLIVSPAAGVTVTITLTTNNVATGKRYYVKKANATDGIVKVLSPGGLIEGTTSIETNVPYQGWVLQFDGVNWHIIGHI